MLHDLNINIVGRLLLAALLGGLIGLERELNHKPASLRTNMLISLGAALFTVMSYKMAGDFGGDHTRIAAQIIPGIGFIGAGRGDPRSRGDHRHHQRIAVGSGMTVTAIFATILILASLVILGKVGDRFGLHARVLNIRITAAATGLSQDRIRAVLEELRVPIRSWRSHKEESGLTIDFDIEATIQQECDLSARLGSMPVRFESKPVPPVTPL